jgi:hypothetical protein
MKEYIVTRSIRGIQTLAVRARSKKEAREKVHAAPSMNSDVEGIDFHIKHYGKTLTIYDPDEAKTKKENRKN